MVPVSRILITTLVTGLGWMLLTASSSRAGSVTAESIMSKDNALSRARALLPSGAVVSSSQCQTVEVRMDNERYICSLSFDIPPSGVTSGASGGGSAGSMAP